MMCGMSSKNGKLFKLYKNKYFNQQDTIEFVKLLQAFHKKKDFAIFWDNASIHKGKDISEYLRKNKITSINNI